MTKVMTRMKDKDDSNDFEAITDDVNSLIEGDGSNNDVKTEVVDKQ